MTQSNWPTCQRTKERCPGIRVEGFEYCLTHLHPEQLTQFLSRLGPGADLDARGTTITNELLVGLTKAVRDRHWRVIFGDVNLEGATFDRVQQLGPWVAHRLFLDATKFDRYVNIDVYAALIRCVDAQFDGGVTMRVANAVIVAERAFFGAPSSIAPSRIFGSYELELQWLPAWEGEREAAGLGGQWPALVSLHGTDVGNLVLVDTDLSLCVFADAHRLDQLRIEGYCPFDTSPGGWRWARRQVLFEENIWRGHRFHPFLEDSQWIPPERIAVLYRSLRKAYEDGKNEAGAGDFYYGEMEMRRRADETPWAERWILAVYWLLSGYGQRAGRAVVAIVVLVAVVSVLLLTVGLPADHVWSWGRVDQSLRIALGAVVFRDAGQTLTSAGAWTVMIARFVGPVLLALGVLAVRARVKR